MNIKNILKHLITAIFVIVIFSTVTLINNKNKNTISFSSFKDSINTSREQILNNKFNMKTEYVNWFDNDNNIFDEDEINNQIEYEKSFYRGKYMLQNSNSVDYNKILTQSEAYEDIDQLFNLLKYNYGAYGYFGGDSAFNDAKTSIESKISNKQDISVKELHSLVTENLTFIKDNHFKLDLNNTTSNELTNGKVYYSYNECFYKDEVGYYRINNFKKCYVKEINNNPNIDEYMLYSIADSGELIYKIEILNEISSLYTIFADIKYSTPSNTWTEKVQLRVSPLGSQNYDNYFTYDIKNNIPVATLKTMFDDPQHPNCQEDFSNCGLDMKNYPVSIIDLRGNIGGRVDAGLDWIKNFTDCTTLPRGPYLTLNSTMIKEKNKKLFNIDNSYSPFYDQVLNVMEVNTIKNDNLIFVLMDKSTMSAAEFFIEALMNLDNVIFVGTNTTGSTLCGSLYHYQLNNSSIGVNLGNKLYISPYSEEFEYTGFEPDIFVDSKDALNRVMKLIKHYQLN